MHLTLLPLLFLAMLATIGREQGATLHAGTGNSSPSLFSVAAQATPTGTLTVQPTVTTVTTVTATTAITPADTVTATAGVTATATVTGTVATPPPLPTVAPQVGLRNPLDPAFLFSRPPADFPARMGPLAWAYLVGMLGLLAASIYFYFVKRPQWKRVHSVHYRAANRWGQVGLWIAGLGLLFLLFRLVALDFFDLRFWLYFWAFAALVAAGAFIYWYRTSYPKELARYLKKERARQYMPQASRRQARQAAASPRAAAQPRPGQQAGSGAGSTAAPATATTERPAQGPAAQRKRRKRR